MKKTEPDMDALIEEGWKSPEEIESVRDKLSDLRLRIQHTIPNFGGSLIDSDLKDIIDDL